MRAIQKLTDAELRAAIDAARNAISTTWAAWEIAHTAGQRDLRCAEFQAHNAAQRRLGTLLREVEHREFHDGSGSPA